MTIADILDHLSQVVEVDGLKDRYHRALSKASRSREVAKIVKESLPKRTQRRRNYLMMNDIIETGDGVYDKDGRRYSRWSGYGRDKMSFEQAWQRLMECQRKPEDWNPPLFYDRLSCKGCRGNRDECRVKAPRPRRRRWSSVPRL